MGPYTINEVNKEEQSATKEPLDYINKEWIKTSFKTCIKCSIPKRSYGLALAKCSKTNKEGSFSILLLYPTTFLCHPINFLLTLATSKWLQKL